MQCALDTKDTRLSNQDIENRIREFVARDILFSDNGFPHDNSASFLKEGVIDSLGVLELVTFASREFGVQVESAEVTPQNFDSVDNLSAFIRRKLGPTAANH